MRAQGKTTNEIADKFNISQPRVSQILSDDKIKSLLTNVHKMYAAASKGIGREFLKLCFDSDKKIRSDNIKEWHKIMGIAPSHAQSVFIQNIYNDNRRMAVAPEVVTLLQDAGLYDIDPETEGNDK